MSMSYLWVNFPERPYRMIYGNFMSCAGAIAWQNETEYWAWRPKQGSIKLADEEPDFEIRELVAKDGYYWFETWSTAYGHSFYKHPTTKCWFLSADDHWEYTNFEWLRRPWGGRRYNSAAWLYKERWLRKEEGMPEDFHQELESRRWDGTFSLSNEIDIWKPTEPYDSSNLEVSVDCVT